MSVSANHKTPDQIASFMQDVIVQYRQVSADCRRTEPRESIAIPVRVQRLDGNLQPVGEAFSVVTRDMSSGGLAFFHTQSLDRGALRICLQAPWTREQMNLLVQVEHCTPCGDFHIVGCRIEAIGPPARDSKRRGE